MEAKVCTKCKVEKSINDYHKDCTTKDGRKFRCKPCSLVVRKAYKVSKESRRKYAESDRKNNLAQFLVRAARARAKLDNLEFNITKHDIIVPEYCPVLKIKLFHGVGGICDNSPTLDKIDPTKGYVVGNIQVISNKANKMKSNATFEELHSFSEWIFHNVPKQAISK